MIPSVYTEQEAAEYQHGVIGPLAVSLGWTVQAGDYAETVNDALLAYGESDISTITGLASILKFRTYLELAVWRRVVAHTSGDFDFDADGGKYSRSQANRMARSNVTALEERVLQLGGGARAVLGSVSVHGDPYGPPIRFGG